MQLLGAVSSRWQQLQSAGAIRCSPQVQSAGALKCSQVQSDAVGCNQQVHSSAVRCGQVQSAGAVSRCSQQVQSGAGQVRGELLLSCALIIIMGVAAAVRELRNRALKGKTIGHLPAQHALQRGTAAPSAAASVRVAYALACSDRNTSVVIDVCYSTS
jgi:hypothetical protein